MHERQCRLHAVIRQVREELLEFRGREHALVHVRARGQRREVRAHVTGQFVLDALAHDEQLAVEVDAGCTLRVIHEVGAERGHDVARGLAEAVGVHRHLAPPERPQALLAGDPLHGPGRRVASRRVGGEERHAGGVGASHREVHPCRGAHERIGDLDEDARTVAGVGLRAGGAAVLHVRERRQAQRDDLAALLPLHVRHEGHAACVVLEARVVEAVGRGEVWVHGASGPWVPWRATGETSCCVSRDDAGPSELSG